MYVHLFHSRFGFFSSEDSHISLNYCNFPLSTFCKGGSSISFAKTIQSIIPAHTSRKVYCGGIAELFLWKVCGCYWQASLWYHCDWLFSVQQWWHKQWDDIWMWKILPLIIYLYIVSIVTCICSLLIISVLLDERLEFHTQSDF